MAENVFGVTQSDLEREPRAERLDREAFMQERVARAAVEGRPAMHMLSSGRPLPNTRVQVLDEGGHPVPECTVGEIALQSDCMLAGYYNRPDLTEQAFRDGWFMTGDYGYLSQGELFVSGRKKDMIIVGGKNVYPQDLEALTYELTGIHAGRSVAFGVFDEQQGTEAVVIVAEADTVDAAERERLAEQIRKHVTQNSAVALRRVQVVGPKWIIKTSSGKTARSASRDKYMREFGAE
jgi:acyl-CoA synthetase (AMP-forming)/AMP-acid ligase II